MALSNCQAGQPREFGSEDRRLLGRQIEGECLDGDQVLVIGIVGTKHRSQHARPDLVQEFEPTESRRRRVRGAWRQFRT